MVRLRFCPLPHPPHLRYWLTHLFYTIPSPDIFFCNWETNFLTFPVFLEVVTSCHVCPTLPSRPMRTLKPDTLTWCLWRAQGCLVHTRSNDTSASSPSAAKCYRPRIWTDLRDISGLNNGKYSKQAQGWSWTHCPCQCTWTRQDWDHSGPQGAHQRLCQFTIMLCPFPIHLLPLHTLQQSAAALLSLLGHSSRGMAENKTCHCDTCLTINGSSVHSDCNDSIHGILIPHICPYAHIYRVL